MTTARGVRRKSSGISRRFIQFNEAICDRIEGLLPGAFTRSLHRAHLSAILTEIPRRTSKAKVLDIGGGQNAPFIDHLSNGPRPTIIALDISEHQISKNKTIDFGIAADACKQFPINDGSIDIAITRSLLEHLTDPSVTVAEIARVLRPGGVCIHLFPSRFSPFAVLNRLIPSKLGRRLLFAIFPEWVHSSGFPAFYRHCDAKTMRHLHEAQGLKIRLLEIRYYEAIYYKFFVPIYLIMALYDYIAYLSQLQFLGSQVMLIAEKPAPHSLSAVC